VSQEDVEMVRTLIDRWNEGERHPSAFREGVDPEVELESPFSSVVGEPYRGYEGLERWLRDNDEQFAEWQITINEVRDVGDQVIVIAAVNARGRASDVALQFPTASVFSFGAADRASAGTARAPAAACARSPRSA
jgi:hypothetical protein